MKLPAAVSGQNLADVDPQSSEGEVVSVISIAVSSIVTMIIIAIGMLVLGPLVSVLENPVLKPGFDNIMPALVGAMLIPYVVKNPKLVIVPLAFALILGTILPSASWSRYQGYLLLINIVISVVAGIVLYRTGALEKKKPVENQKDFL